MKTAAGAFLMGEGSYEFNCLSAKRQSLTLPAKPQDNPALTAKPIDLSPLVKEGATALLVELEKSLGR